MKPGELRLVADVAILVRGSVVLVRYRDVSDYDGQRGWFVPDGYLAHGEHPEEAARRIAHEQLGVELADVRQTYIESFANGTWHLIFHYVAELEDLPELIPGENVAAHERFGLGELPPASETAHDGWTLEIVERARGSA